ncbi:MAG: undecaprenyl-diphosphate phosphatase [Syntrophales bacterium]|jgi:undecaprenyl-diphosphatase|nr:undecaprenyl-diphosphate phosphatase [Syntrophales bacterium]
MGKRLHAAVIVALTLLVCSFSALGSEGTPGENPAVAVEQKIMTTPQAVVLGVVEGLTEYLPVSSTGHLLLAEKIMGIGEDPRQSPAQREQTKEAVDAYTICIQAGAILAVLWLYSGRIKQILRGMMGKDSTGRRLLFNVVAGFLPAAVLGLLFNRVIKSYLFGPWPVVAAWLLGGLAILAVSWRNRARDQGARTGSLLDDMTWRMALIIGFAQCIAMWPGVSRSLVTIVGGLLVGLTMEAAVEYSFLLGVVTLGAATAYDTLKHGQLMLQTFDHFSLIVGVVVAFIAAAISVKWMVSYLSRHGLEIFGYYRVAIAVATTVFLLTTKMKWI